MKYQISYIADCGENIAVEPNLFDTEEEALQQAVSRMMPNFPASLHVSEDGARNPSAKFFSRKKMVHRAEACNFNVDAIVADMLAH